MRIPPKNLTPHQTNAFVRPPLEVHWFDVCDSTNQQLLAAAESGAAAGQVYAARAQVAGRGRRGRHWLAEPGNSLAFSLLWTFPAEPQRLQGLPLLVGLAVVDALVALKAHPGLNGPVLGLKWPNDVMLHRAAGMDAKVGGILVESTTRRSAMGRPELAVVIGVGLNCLATDSLQQQILDRSIGSLSEFFPEAILPELLLVPVLEGLQRALVDFEAHGFEPFVEAWNQRDLWQGKRVQIQEAGQIILQGTAAGVDKTGALCIKTPAGIERVVAGDVSLRKV